MSEEIERARAISENSIDALEGAIDDRREKCVDSRDRLRRRSLLAAMM
jgi:hypothetical protein